MQRCVFFSVICAALIAQVFAGECALSLHGNSHVGLSATSRLFTSNIDRAQYSYELWFTPSRHVSGEQSLLQTGIVEDAQGSWAVEVKYEATIWQQTDIVPAVSVLFVDVWANSNAKWTKTRFYTTLGGDSFPWAHIAFEAASNTITVNNQHQTVKKFATKSSASAPGSDFALGYGFDGMIDEVRIWSGMMQDSSRCPDTTSQLELYLPFRECSGNVFVGQSYDTTLCTITYGDIDWTKSSPVSHPECLTQVSADVCKGAKQVTPSPQISSLLMTGAQPSALPLVALLCAVGCIALLIAYHRHRQAAAAAHYSRLSSV